MFTPQDCYKLGEPTLPWSSLPAEAQREWQETANEVNAALPDEDDEEDTAA